jgi:hypothetical protein
VARQELTETTVMSRTEFDGGKDKPDSKVWLVWFLKGKFVVAKKACYIRIE